MKTNKEDIVYIDRWLRFAGIQYIDVRYELIDHLVSEYEQSSTVTDLNVFVQNRLDWCKMTAEKKEKTMHWAVQKNLFKRFLKFWLNPKYLLTILLFIAFSFFLSKQFSEKTTKLILLAPGFISAIIYMYLSAFKGFGRKAKEQVLSIQKLGTLFAFPQIFISLFAFPETVRFSLNLFVPVMILMTLMNIAAIFEYLNLRKTISGEYKFLKKEIL